MAEKKLHNIYDYFFLIQPTILFHVVAGGSRGLYPKLLH